MSNINIEIAQVIEVNDPQNCDRIKVKCKTDNISKLNEIPWAYPLLPKMFYIKPKKDEWVIILLTAGGDNKSGRYYIGPIVSQPQDMLCSLEEKGALSRYADSGSQPKISPETKGDIKGAFADEHDIAIYGRKGCDIILKENDIRVRCGARIDADNELGKAFNKKSPAYLKMKYYDNQQITRNCIGDEIKYNSVATMVADEINLISNSSKTPQFGTTDNMDMIADDMLKSVIQNAHVLPYGDVLVDFLYQFLEAFKHHYHAYPGLPTALPKGEERIFNYEFKNMLSKHIRIN